jgi:hypothetical protein
MPAAGFAATADDFYERLLQRGMTHFAAAGYASAYTELRIAAFGMVDNIDDFEIAESYACVAAHRLGRDSDARDSLIRIVSAEKLKPRYRSIKLADDVRADVDSVAANLLVQEEATLLGVTVATKAAVVVPTPSTRPNVAVTAPREGADAGPPPSDAPVPAAGPSDRKPPQR